MFKNLELSGTEVLGIFVAAFIITIGLILCLKLWYSSFDYQAFESKIPNTKPLNFSKKLAEVDVLNRTSGFFNYGLLVGVVLSLAALSWTTYESNTYQTADLAFVDDMIEIDIPRIPEPPASPPPPPLPKVIEVPDTEVVDEARFESTEVSLNDVVVVSEKIEIPIAPPKLPKAREVEVEEIFKVVEQMPRFPGCEDKGTEEEKTACATQKMLEYIYKNLKYPAIARENGVEGGVVLQFVVDKDGTITDTKIARDIGAGCGAAAEAVVLSMNNMGKKWTPGKQRGRPVKVLFTLPVKFKLE